MTYHPYKENFLIKHNQLYINGISLENLSHRVGQTPFYAYDRSLLTQRMQHLRHYMPDALNIHYAIKANPMPALVQHMSTLVDGFDVASAKELKMTLDTGMSANNISLAGPGKQISEIKQAIAAGITLNIESKNELKVAAEQSNILGITANIAIRINPRFELKSAGMKMTGGSKPFGIDEEQLPDILKTLKAMNLNFKGFHIFSGSQNLKAEAIIEAQQQSFILADKLSDYYSEDISHLNIGGGFGIPYFLKDKPLDIKIIADHLAKNMADFKKNHPTTKIIIELGRYLVGEAGIYVCKIIDKKISRGKIFLIVDGGLHHHLAASGNFGQIIRKNYPIIIGNNIQNERKEIVNITGPLCTPLDILADNIELPCSNIGDFIVVFQSGAYGYSASPHKFLSQPDCIEVMV